ncbi:MAG: 4-hydroxybenzoate octaprenyltransferase [Alphaproteobacteria bacterium]|nr:MAG: 4-hydroxybenzoate octaprenyltransferase [Alphaproteobacteria bacterium]
MSPSDEIVPDSERRGLVGGLPAALRPYASLMRLDRPIGAWLLFWPGAWSVALAGLGHRGWVLIALLALGAWAMRSAGCVWNDIIDRDLDAKVERTRLRPLASGRASMKGALLLLAALCLIGLGVLLQLGRTAQIVALASLAPVAAYPFMKRITWWPQAWLGLVFSWAALVGWPAVTGELDATPLLLYVGSIAWVIGYLALGRHAGLGILIFYVVALAFWAAAIWRVRADLLALLALLPMALHLLWQVAALRPEDPADALAKFRSNRFAGLLLFLACLVVGTS